MTNFPAIVFTDLDGTLLDHHSYDYSPAKPAINLLIKNNIPIILASSKTAAEILPLRLALSQSAHPAIVENGAGILSVDSHDDVKTGRDYLRIQQILDNIPLVIRRHFKGFADVSEAELAQMTGLSLAQSRLAKTRDFSEPGLWTGSNDAKTEFLNLLAQSGISARQGGRFLTLSFGETKADQMASICNKYGNPPIIALGDAPNDLEMLLAADYPILIRNPDSAALSGLSPAQSNRIARSTLIGPAGWSQMILRILPTLTPPKHGA